MEFITLRRSYFMGRAHEVRKVAMAKTAAKKTGVLQLNNINFFETLDIALFFCQFFCIFYSYFLVLCDIIVSGGVSYG